MKKLDDDKVTYFDTDSITFMCECGSEMTIVYGEDVCSICRRKYYSKVEIMVYELEEGDETENLLDEDRNDEAD